MRMKREHSQPREVRKDGGSFHKWKGRRAPMSRRPLITKVQSIKDLKIDYKNFSVLQKFLNDRGKIYPRRISGLTSKDQRRLTTAINRARFLALLPTGGVKK